MYGSVLVLPGINNAHRGHSMRRLCGQSPKVTNQIILRSVLRYTLRVTRVTKLGLQVFITLLVIVIFVIIDRDGIL